MKSDSFFQRKILTIVLLILLCIVFSGKTSASTPPPPPPPPFFVGINVSGAEFGKNVPGKEGIDYVYPTLTNFFSLKKDGFSLVRVPFRWERLQPSATSPLDPEALKRLDRIVDQALQTRLSIVLDLHNSGKYYGNNITKNEDLRSAYVDFWGTLAKRYRSSKHVILGLMNEPIGMTASAWETLTQDTVTAIRREGFTGVILVSGVNYSGVHSWFKKWDGISNADAISHIKDPLRNTAVDLHQYFDVDYSGTHKECKENFNVETVFSPVTDWLQKNNLKGFLGEYGSGDDEACLAALTSVHRYLRQNKITWIGSAYWATGNFWPPRYPLLIDKRRNVGVKKLEIIQGANLDK